MKNYAGQVILHKLTILHENSISSKFVYNKIVFKNYGTF